MTVSTVLWMDDQPDFLGPLKRLLAHHGMPLTIEPVTSIAQADKKLRESSYSAFVADCRMDDLDVAGQNGAAFLQDVNHAYPALPTFVCSAYLEDPMYESRIERSNAIASADKTRVLPRSLKDDHFLNELYSAAQAYDPVKDYRPESIQYRHYLSDPEQYSMDVESHWQRHHVWIVKELARRGHVWGVVCGEEVVQSSNDLFDFPAEQSLQRIGCDYNLIPFAYSLPFPPESLDAPQGWRQTKYPKDFYPCVRLRLTDIVIDDFDTGAFQTHVSDELVELGILDRVRSHSDGVHLGRAYRSVTKNIKVTLLAEDGTERSSNLTVCVVKDWKSSPFVDVSNGRKMLIGRDIFRAFNVEISLNSKTRRSTIRFLDADGATDNAGGRNG